MNIQTALMRQLKTKAMLCKAPLSNSSILWTMICIQYAARFLNHLRRLIKWEPHGFMKISLHRIFKFWDKCWSSVDWSLIDFVMMKNCYICPCILRWMYYGIWHWACLSVFLSVLLSISQAACHKLYTIYVRWSFLASAGLIMAGKRPLNNFKVRS